MFFLVWKCPAPYVTIHQKSSFLLSLLLSHWTLQELFVRCAMALPWIIRVSHVYVCLAIQRHLADCVTQCMLCSSRHCNCPVCKVWNLLILNWLRQKEAITYRTIDSYTWISSYFIQLYVFRLQQRLQHVVA